MVDHDHSYKLLFSHPEMVRDLLRGFVRRPWVGQLDFSTLERVSGTYVSDDLDGRTSDIVWRARCGERDVYIAIEFQSSTDQEMALRVLSYVVLLYQELLREKKIVLEAGLPTVVPIVLYNGESRWSASRDFTSLLCESPEGAAEYRPQFRYLLIDERRYDDRELARLGNRVATLFRLEHGCQRDQIPEIAGALMEDLSSAGLFSLRRAFGVWLNRVSRARLARASDGSEEGAEALWERQSMLADRFDQWEAELLQEGKTRLLAHMLRKRFGELPAPVLTRLGSAPSSRLELWGERLFDAASLSDVFDGD
jgi:hypothetical protein